MMNTSSASIISQTLQSSTVEVCKELDQIIENKQKDDSIHQKHSSKKHKKKSISKKSLKVLARKTVTKRKHNLPSENYVQTSKGFPQREQMKKQRETASSNQNFLHYLSQYVEEICCPICSGEIIEPMSTDCGHLFCLKCIEGSMLISNRCPICRETLIGVDKYGPGFSKGVQKLLLIVNSKIQPQAHLENAEEYRSWKESRFTSEEDLLSYRIKKIDILTSEGKWKKAEVLDLYLSEEGTINQILVKYEDDVGMSFSEVVEFQSLRVAKYGFYTNRRLQTFNSSIRASFRNISEFIEPNPEGTTDSVERDSPRQNVGPFIRGLDTNEEGRYFLLIPERVIHFQEPPSHMSFVESQILSCMSEQSNHGLFQNLEEQN